MSPFDRMRTTSYSTLIETLRLYCTVFEIRPVICRKSPILTHPTCIWWPRRGWPPIEFRGFLWHQKTRFPGLLCAFVCVILCSAVLVKHRLVTDRHRRTQAHYIYRASIASRGKNLLTETLAQPCMHFYVLCFALLYAPLFIFMTNCLFVH